MISSRGRNHDLGNTFSGVFFVVGDVHSNEYRSGVCPFCDTWHRRLLLQQHDDGGIDQRHFSDDRLRFTSSSRQAGSTLGTYGL